MGAPDLHLSVPADHAQCAGIRSEIRLWWSSGQTSQDQLDDALLVATELVSNAVNATHRSGTDGRPIHLRAEHRSEGFCIEVHNEGPGFDPNALPEPLPDQPSGRGIGIARSLGRLTVAQQGSFTVVRVERPV